MLLHVANPLKTGEQYLKVQDAFARTLAFLDPDCESYLNSGGGDVRSYVSGLFENNLAAVGDFDTKYVAFTNATGTDLPDGFAAMVFNTTSAFFTGTVAGTSTSLSVDNGLIKGGTNQAQVFVILHELAHAVGASGFESDFNVTDPAAAEERNDNRIDSHCKKTFGAIR